MIEKISNKVKCPYFDGNQQIFKIYLVEKIYYATQSIKIEMFIYLKRRYLHGKKNK